MEPISKTLNFNDARVAVIGDFVLDRYVTGSVSRVSPEAPVPVLLRKNERSVLGGAGNVAANIKALGATPIPVGLLGSCGTGSSVKNLLQKLNIDTEYLNTSGARSTPVKTRFIGGHQQILRLDDETVQPPSKVEADWLLAVANAIDCDAVILSDYGKGLLMNGVTEKIIKILKDRNIPIFVDPKGTDYTKYSGATALSPNLKELAEASRTNPKREQEIAEAARELIFKLDLEFVIATRGEEGLTTVFRETEFHIPTYAREVFDVSGAGDTLISTFAVAHASGFTIETSCRIANAAAGLVVAKNGTATVSIEEVDRAFHKRTHRIGSEKTQSLQEGVETVDDWRSRGLKVGFTNGCFDIIHPGHISLFEQAAATCDRLIVGLNSDASISKLKGPTRPIVDQESRAAVLAALNMIDLIIPFEQETPIDLIRALKPDVLVKGGDYQEHEIVGADIVKENGGKVKRAKFAEGKSTTDIVKRIVNSLESI